MMFLGIIRFGFKSSIEAELMDEMFQVHQSLHPHLDQLEELNNQYSKEPSPRLIDAINRVLEQIEVKQSEGYKPILDQLKLTPIPHISEHIKSDMDYVAEFRDSMSRFSERRR